MGDDLVDEVLESVESVRFANGLERSALRPVIDAIVNRLRASGLRDERIAEIMAE